MDKNQQKVARRTRRRTGIRKRLLGTPERPRLSVFRSNKHLYAQVIDDMEGRTLASASTLAAGLDKGGTVEAAKQVGSAVAESAKAAGVSQVAFDRNGYRYHGRVAALAQGAREGGLEF